MNILIVDDQKKVLEATEKLVNWKKLQIDGVFTANSAAQAKSIMLQHPIDILLTDIEMPGEDGIELQRWQAKEYPYVLSVFLTSHADFAYAKEALRNGAFDYILQPAGISEIEQVIGRCIKRLEEREAFVSKGNKYDAELPAVLETHVFSMFHQKGKFLQMEDWRRDSQTQEPDWWYLPCLVEIWRAGSAEVKAMLDQALAGLGEDGISFVSACLHDHEIGILFYSRGNSLDPAYAQEKLRPVQQLVTEKHGCELNVYLGQYAKGELQKQIGQIIDFKEHSLLKRNTIYLVGEPKTASLRKPDYAEWGRWLVRGDTALVKNQITNMLQYTQQEQQLTIEYMRMLIHAFLEACSIACHEQKAELTELFTDDFTYEQMLRAYSSVEALQESVSVCLSRYEAILREKEGGRAAASVSERIQEVQRFLENNIDRMIPRKEAAQYVYLNEDYFSRMFRKETGLGYKEYLLKIKVGYACKLLAQTDMPVAVIAAKVGYDNYTHFTQMFKKSTGTTPREYRANNQSAQ